MPGLPQLPESADFSVQDKPAVGPAELKAPDSPPRKKTAMSELFGDVFITSVVPGSGRSLQQQIEEELCKFKAEPCIAPERNPLDWWKSNELNYPHLALFAKCVLAIPGTSVPSERIFSTAGDIVYAQRACLSPENVNILIFLKKNLQF